MTIAIPRAFLLHKRQAAVVIMGGADSEAGGRAGVRRVVIVTAVLAGAFAVGGYLWVQATFVLPSASCGSGGAVGQTLYSTAAQVRSESRSRQCFLAAARTCAAAGVAVHAPGTEESDDLVYVIDAARSRGECRVTEYSQETGMLGPRAVRAEACRGTPVAGYGVLISCPGRTWSSFIASAVNVNRAPLSRVRALRTANVY